MTKIITINSCRECDCRNGMLCRKYELLINDIDTIHPDCKLNDLPTKEEIKEEAYDYSSLTVFTGAFVSGANFVINKINGK